MVTVAVPEPPASMMVLPPSHGSSSSSTGVVPGESPVAVYVCQVALVSVSMPMALLAAIRSSEADIAGSRIAIGLEPREVVLAPASPG